MADSGNPHATPTKDHNALGKGPIFIALGKYSGVSASLKPLACLIDLGKFELASYYDNTEGSS